MSVVFIRIRSFIFHTSHFPHIFAAHLLPPLPFSLYLPFAQDERVRQLARLFFEKLNTKEKGGKSPIYNAIPDVLSRFANDVNMHEKRFQNILGYLLGFITVDKDVAGLVEKLCHRIVTADQNDFSTNHDDDDDEAEDIVVLEAAAEDENATPPSHETGMGPYYRRLRAEMRQPPRDSVLEVLSWEKDEFGVNITIDLTPVRWRKPPPPPSYMRIVSLAKAL